MNSNQEQNNKEIMDEEKINSEEIKIDEQSIEIEDSYKFGWSNYSEITNGRFAMLGFLAIILIELISQKSFLNWAGIF
ncbi:chlorophyll a-b binding domain-containing protein [Prochlorococcus sp. AH-716-K03]|nr:chlorophyll a-b binding domain-containing protein [Prochlorococcus sp. AH-716-K03]